MSSGSRTSECLILKRSASFETDGFMRNLSLASHHVAIPNEASLTLLAFCYSFNPHPQYFAQPVHLPAKTVEHPVANLSHAPLPAVTVPALLPGQILVRSAACQLAFLFARM